MNEPANFCNFPCDNPDEAARWRNLPPPSPPKKDQPRSIPGFPHSSRRERVISWATKWFPAREAQEPLRAPADVEGIAYVEVDHKGDDLLHPPYRIHNHQGNGDLSDQTVRTDAQHANGLWEYDTHNIYGASK